MQHIFTEVHDLLVANDHLDRRPTWLCLPTSKAGATLCKWNISLVVELNKIVQADYVPRQIQDPNCTAGVCMNKT